MGPTSGHTDRHWHDTHLFLNVELVNGCEKIIADHLSCVSASGGVEFNEMLLESPDVVIVGRRMDVGDAD
jgi:hypothetical protein